MIEVGMKHFFQLCRDLEKLRANSLPNSKFRKAFGYFGGAYEAPRSRSRHCLDKHTIGHTLCKDQHVTLSELAMRDQEDFCVRLAHVDGHL